MLYEEIKIGNTYEYEVGSPIFQKMRVVITGKSHPKKRYYSVEFEFKDNVEGLAKGSCSTSDNNFPSIKETEE